MRLILFLITYLAFPSSVLSATYYVMTDGGEYGVTSSTCNGLSDVAFTGANGPNCAVNHPFEVLGVEGAASYPQIISGGDTVIIGNGSFRMGHTVGTYNANGCHESSPWDCHNASLPSGTVETPTRILGEDWSSGCSTMPELYGVERADHVLYTSGTDNIEFQCLELTDHVACVDNGNHAVGECNDTTYPYGDWATEGLHIETATNVKLTNINAHGLGNNGIATESITNLDVDNVTVRGNGMAGWEGGSSHAGTLTFNNFLVEYNGCLETYPGLEPSECWAQTGGGYGDGFGLEATSGDWYFTDCEFKHNTSDGLDTLYVLAPGTVTITRSLFEGNSGNQIKISGAQMTLMNSKIIGNCKYFDGNPMASATEWVGGSDNCRAGGDAIVFALTRIASTGHDAVMINNSLLWESNYGVFLAESAGICDETETFYARNNILQSSDNSLSTFGSDCTGLVPDIDYTVAHNTFGTPCSGQANCWTTDPLYTSIDFVDETFDLDVSAPLSPAHEAGLAVGTSVSFSAIPVDDNYGTIRTLSTPDIGMHEYGGVAPPSGFTGSTFIGTGSTFIGTGTIGVQ